jgi:hypothetical protein
MKYLQSVPPTHPAECLPVRRGYNVAKLPSPPVLAGARSEAFRMIATAQFAQEVEPMPRTRRSGAKVECVRAACFMGLQ